MIGWISSFWTYQYTSGPARNLPENVTKVKEFFDQRPTQVMLLSSEEVVKKLASLRPTITNANPPMAFKSPIMSEFDSVFSMGVANYFAQRKKLMNE
jgi:hypothetical protein